MNVKQSIFQYPFDPATLAAESNPTADLVLAFGCVEAIEDPTILENLKTSFPKAIIAGCSGASQIQNSEIYEDRLCLTAMQFDSTTIRSIRKNVAEAGTQREIGTRLGEELNADDLVYVMILVDGLTPDCDEIIFGLRNEIGDQCAISGGRAADNWQFQQTLVLDRDGAHKNSLLAIGFYGSNFKASTAAVSGWTDHGGVAKITKCDNNRLLKLDNQPALEIYQKHLGPEAENLPKSGLHFPIQLMHGDKPGLIRTPVSIDEEVGSFDVSGMVHEGDIRMLVFTSAQDLIDGAVKAAEKCPADSTNGGDSLALLISCAARREAMGPATELEIEAIYEAYGEKIACSGFYAYGEICDFDVTGQCELHNQTMTVTMLSEG